MKKLILIAVLLVLVLSACAPMVVAQGDAVALLRPPPVCPYPGNCGSLPPVPPPPVQPFI
jgi:hypothetical protein